MSGTFGVGRPRIVPAVGLLAIIISHSIVVLGCSLKYQRYAAK